MPTVFQLRERVADMQLGYSEEKRQYLEVRRRGADNKDKGTEFERHYGVHHLMRGAFNSVTRHEDGSRFFVSSNLVADVDDLYVSGDNELLFCQAKDRKELSWSEVSERFEQQVDDLQEFKLLRYSTVELVVSRSELQLSLEQKRPDKLKDVNVVHFKNSLDDFLPFAELLTARLGDQCAKENAQHHYYDAWRTLDFSASVGSVARRAHRLSYGNMRTLDANVTLPLEVQEALDNVEFLTPKVIGRRLYYAFNDEELAPLRWEIDSPNWHKFVTALSHAKNLDYLGFLKLLDAVK